MGLHGGLFGFRSRCSTKRGWECSRLWGWGVVGMECLRVMLLLGRLKYRACRPRLSIAVLLGVLGDRRLEEASQQVEEMIA